MSERSERKEKNMENIDKIYEQCALKNSKGSVVIKKYYDDIASYLRKPDYLVIKAHGCVDDTQKIVFTHEQYNKARYQYASFYRHAYSPLHRQYPSQVVQL